MTARRSAKPTKYRAVRTVVDGHKFASKKEARRYGELKLLQKAGFICDLKLQPKIKLSANGVDICTYIGDFFYYKRGHFKVSENQVGGEAGKFIYEDVKGMRTPIYRLKKKLVLALTGITITEV